MHKRKGADCLRAAKDHGRRVLAWESLPLWSSGLAKGAISPAGSIMRVVEFNQAAKVRPHAHLPRRILHGGFAALLERSSTAGSASLLEPDPPSSQVDRSQGGGADLVST